MKKFFARAIAWILPCALFLFNDEILSLLALTVLGLMVIGGLVNEREKCRG